MERLRKLGCTWSVVLALLVLTACSASVEKKEPEVLPEISTGMAQGNMAATSGRIDYVIESDLREDSVFSEDGTELLHYRYDLPVLRAYREDGSEITEPVSVAEKRAESMTAVFNATFADWAEEDFASISAYAEEDYAFRKTQQPMEWAPYGEEFTHVYYALENLVSIRASYWGYTGGPHGNTVLLAWNFALDSGSFLNPVDLALDSREFSEAVAAELSRQAEAKAAEAGVEPRTYFWEDYEDILKNWPSYAVSFDESGMTVAFSPYELACYAAGPQSFLVDYDFLQPFLTQDGAALLELTEPEAAS